MTRPSSKLLPKVPGGGRRAQFSASTKRSLVEVATEVFTERGYAGTSLDQIVAGAEVTKGALYHHFHGKAALFETVFEQVEQRAAKKIQKAVQGHRDPWEKATAGLSAFLEVSRDRVYQRIVVLDGPAVLGYERFREQEERSTFATVTEIVRAVLQAGSWDLEDDLQETFSRIFFGAMSSAGANVATSEDPDRASALVEVAVGFLLTGLRALAESGIELELPDLDDGPGEDDSDADEEEDAGD